MFNPKTFGMEFCASMYKRMKAKKVFRKHTGHLILWDKVLILLIQEERKDHVNGGNMRRLG